MAKRYNIAYYTSGRPCVYEVEFGTGTRTKTEAERFVRRWHLAESRLAAQNPPSYTSFNEIRDSVLHDIADGTGPVPSGANILDRISATERAAAEASR